MKSRIVGNETKHVKRVPPPTPSRILEIRVLVGIEEGVLNIGKESIRNPTQTDMSQFLIPTIATKMIQLAKINKWACGLNPTPNPAYFA